MQKTNLIIRSALALLAGGAFGLVVQIAEASPIQQSSVKSASCQGVDFRGTYDTFKTSDYVSTDIQIEQNGCLLKVTSTSTYSPNIGTYSKSVVWNFDLSGQTDFITPPAIIAANDSSQLGQSSLRSLKIKTKLSTTIEPGYGVKGLININGSIHLPVMEKNLIESDLAFIGQMYFLTDRDGKVSYIDLSYRKAKVRLKAVQNLGMYGLMDQSFIKGANYILSFLDDINAVSLIVPELTSMQRLN